MSDKLNLNLNLNALLLKQVTSDTNPGESEIEHLVAACDLDFECAVKLKELGITKISHLCDISKEELGKELKLSVEQVRFYLCIGYFF